MSVESGQIRHAKRVLLLTDTMLSQVGKISILPSFDDTRLHSGAMRVRCANATTRQWLVQNVPKLDKKKL